MFCLAKAENIVNNSNKNFNLVIRSLSIV